MHRGRVEALPLLQDGVATFRIPTQLVILVAVLIEHSKSAFEIDPLSWMGRLHAAGVPASSGVSRAAYSG
jgi:hypothetical protein